MLWWHRVSSAERIIRDVKVPFTVDIWCNPLRSEFFIRFTPKRSTVNANTFSHISPAWQIYASFWWQSGGAVERGVWLRHVLAFTPSCAIFFGAKALCELGQIHLKRGIFIFQVVLDVVLASRRTESKRCQTVFDCSVFTWQDLSELSGLMWRAKCADYNGNVQALSKPCAGRVHARPLLDLAD